MSLTTILVLILVFALVAPQFGAGPITYNGPYGPYYGGGVGLLLIVLLFLLLVGRI